MKLQLTLRVSPDQLAAYDHAAQLAGAPRHAWMVGVIRRASGLGGPRSGKIIQDIISEELPPRNKSIVVKLPESIGAGADASAREAWVTTGQWCVIVLDHAAGISELAIQLGRVK